MAVSDECVELLVALEEAGVIASMQDAEGYAITLQSLAEMEDAGWKFVPPEEGSDGSG